MFLCCVIADILLFVLCHRWYTIACVVSSLIYYCWCCVIADILLFVLCHCWYTIVCVVSLLIFYCLCCVIADILLFVLCHRWNTIACVVSSLIYYCLCGVIANILLFGFQEEIWQRMLTPHRWHRWRKWSIPGHCSKWVSTAEYCREYCNTTLYHFNEGSSNTVSHIW